METFEGRVAVVTGGASGIGLATAKRFAKAGMKIVLADIETAALNNAVDELKSGGADAIGVPSDVSKEGDVKALAQATLERHGAVHVLFNNAGVGTEGACWENSLDDWKWVLGVNLWGVVNGIRTFVPIMLEQGAPAHVVNTSSMAGMVSNPGMGIYNVTKFSVVTLTETLYLELLAVQSPVRASVLCPGFVRTNIIDAERNRPANMGTTAAAASPLADAIRQGLRTGVEAGFEPSVVADAVMDGIREERFYIFAAQDELRAAMGQRFEAILEGTNPVLPPMP